MLLTKSQEFDNQVHEKLGLQANFTLENDRLKSEIEDLRFQLQLYE